MSKNGKRRMIRAASSKSIIQFDVGGVEWVKAAEDTSDKPKRFSMTAYTGGPMVVGYYGAPVVIDLTGLTAVAPLPILLNHDMIRIVGHADSVDVGASTLKLAGLISGASQEAEQVQASAANGFPWKASVGARPDKMEFVGEDATVKVNGKTVKGPVYVARKATLGEVSFVAMAADGKTSAKVAAIAAFSQKENGQMKFEQWVRAMGFDVDSLTEDQRANLQAKFDAEQKPVEPKPAEKIEAAAVVDPVADMRAKAAAEASRIEAVSKAANGNEAIRAKAIAEGWDSTKTELESIKAAMPKAPAIHASTRDTQPNVIEAAICQTLNLPEIEKSFDDKTLQAAHTAFRGRIGLQQVLLMAAAANGYAVQSGERVTQSSLRSVLRHAMAIEAAGTLSLPGILNSVANRELLQGFMEEDQTWREVAAIRSVSDFKAVTSYRLNDNLEYDELPPGQSITHGTFGEESYTRQARTYAKMASLDRSDIINDDMGALNDIRTRLGRGAARKFLNVFWAKFINNSAFFTAARGNYVSGATTNLATDGVGLAAGIKAFDDLKSVAVAPAKTGKRIGGVPTILLVPPELEAIAMQLYTPIAAAEAAKVNVYAGRYRPIKVHQLSDSSFTGYSATAWYLLRNPGILAPMVVSFLNGVQTPTIESSDADFDQLGVLFRGYHDFGCDQAEYLCGVKSKGSA